MRRYKSTIASAQLKAKNGKRGPKIARWLIGEKVAASISMLKSIIPASANTEAAIQRLEKRHAEICNPRKSITISQLLGIEGDCAAAYYRTWHGLPIKWSRFKRRPVPGNWFEISPRTMTWRKGAQNARHPINAMLNYGYGVLKSQIKSEVIAAGLDPSVGIIHGNWRNRDPLVNDLMEPLRPVVDRGILEFALSHSFTSGDFTINNLGGCRLNPQLARVITKRIAEASVSHIVRAFIDAL